MRYILNLILLIVVSCSFPNLKNERLIVEIEENCFFINKNDTLKLGINKFKKDLFDGLDTELFPNIQYDGMQPPQQNGIYDNIEGVYINSKIFDSFDLKNESISKIDNAFDILFIYPEVSRYNFQFSQALSYRIFHYFGYLYQDPSSSENLPYYVQKIKKISSNNLLITYEDKSSYLKEKDKIDTLIFSTYPNIKMDFYDNGVAGFQKSNEYIKLSDETIKGVDFSVPFNTLPQDITELYMREIITNLVNLRFNSKLNTNEILKN